MGPAVEQFDCGFGHSLPLHAQSHNKHALASNSTNRAARTCSSHKRMPLIGFVAIAYIDAAYGSSTIHVFKCGKLCDISGVVIARVQLKPIIQWKFWHHRWIQRLRFHSFIPFIHSYLSFIHSFILFRPVTKHSVWHTTKQVRIGLTRLEQHLYSRPQEKHTTFMTP